MIRHSISLAVAGFILSSAGSLSVASAADVKNIVIVHGAFVDGAGWRPVSDILTKQGYKVTIAQQSLISPTDDIAATKRILDLQDGSSILVGHSAGGMIISEAGKADNVAGLVYIAAFQPEKGESIVKLATSDHSHAKKESKVKTLKDGYSYIEPDAFAETFAADLPKETTDFLAHSQVFASKAIFSTEAGEPAWKTKKSWALVATDDKSISPELERSMAKRAGSTVVEVKASHAVYASQPQDVAKLIAEAAQTVSK
ncbi:alpha/beta fold hydrolase [Phyllobacterium meliloti]|uniref:alpha/beta fold hydrolase n=1 Tax=Phyllobacterium meliloti TaxID=555317 RepID=UPI001D13C649|nr:alpha/beta hydrolase [Phyllobacterium sp. T1293]UGX88321.1 alpha/beta hydrolase [Phyllobacterium sp. T1293]